MSAKTCPLLKKPCIEHACAFYTHITGTNPNTGKQVDEFGCAVSWLPFLILETAKETRQGAAAVESFRNEMVEANRLALQLSTQPKLETA
jgi:hypothetical protein